MTRVAILPEKNKAGHISYRAISGNLQSLGKTAGQALDALTEQINEDETGTLVIVQNLRPDKFFTAAQQQRLSELMDQWRLARDQGQTLQPNEQSELDNLIETELRAATLRATALLGEAAQ